MEGEKKIEERSLLWEALPLTAPTPIDGSPWHAMVGYGRLFVRV